MKARIQTLFIGALLTGAPFLLPAQVVTNNADSGPGSLRVVVANAISGDTITFASALSGATILLTNGEIVLNKNLTMDGSALTNGIRIDGNAGSRIFTVTNGVTAVLDSLTLTNGFAASGAGGAILNRGGLTLNNCTVVSNRATSYGGGIENTTSATLTINQSTFTGNSCASAGGGGIDVDTGVVVVNQSTITANATTHASGCGGIYNASGTLTISNSIVAGNSAPTTPNIAGTFTGTDNLTNNAPLLAQLGNYGGPTPTRPPLPGSLAIDGCLHGTTFTNDQRGVGFLRVVGSHADIGAVESGNAIPDLLVNTAADENDGLGTNGISLRDAVAFAPAGSTIRFAPSLSGQTILLTNGQITLNKNLVVDGSTLADGIRLNGNGNVCIFTVSSNQTVTLDALTLTNGFATSGAGGAILNYGQVTVNNCTVTGNHAASFGGGIEDTVGAVLIINQSTLTGNSCGDAGGGAIDVGIAVAVINQSTITGNATANASSCGGIYNYQGTLTVSNSIVAGNSAPTTPNIYGAFTGADNLTNNTPLLAPLGNYGGPTPTCPPLPGSPAIDGCTNGTAFATDQRGFTRLVGNAADIGAVESQSTVVLNTNDSGFGSLRDIMIAATSGSVITFTNTLSGQTILLTHGQIQPSQSVTLDASALANGISINGSANGRIFEFPSNNTNVLESLTLMNGFATAGTSGGAILNNGSRLTLNNCTLAGNRATLFGGGIENTLGGTVTINQSTFSGNACDGAGGGGIDLDTGLVAVNQSTVTGNSTTNSGSGGIFRYQGTLTINNSIVAGNTAPTTPNISGAFTGADNLTNSAPMLAVLGNYGGPTPTRPPLAGSPAIDGCTNGTVFTTDQRGLPRIVGPFADIGAVEYQGAVIIATNPPVLTNATVTGNGSFGFAFTNLAGASFTVFASTNLDLPLNLWSNLGAVVETPAGSGQYQFTDADATNYPQRFYQVVSP